MFLYTGTEYRHAYTHTHIIIQTNKYTYVCIIELNYDLFELKIMHLVVYEYIKKTIQRIKII